MPPVDAVTGGAERLAFDLLYHTEGIEVPLPQIVIPLKLKSGRTTVAFEVNNQILRDAVAKRGWPSPPSGQLSVWGVRGAVPYENSPAGVYLLTLKENVVNAWNDTLGVMGSSFAIYKGTVDPGLPYTEDPVNSAGCAHLKDGYYTYVLGDHKGHEALVQGGPVDIWRDADEDSTEDASELDESGYFGINIHAGSGDEVDDWSAGCQVVWSANGWSGPQWTDFLNRVKSSGQPSWTYYLLSAADVCPD